jgi:hypothetical protein
METVSQFAGDVQLSSTRISPAVVVVTDRYREHPQQIGPPAWSTTTGCGAGDDKVGGGLDAAGDEPLPQDGPTIERIRRIANRGPRPSGGMASAA